MSTLDLNPTATYGLVVARDTEKEAKDAFQSVIDHGDWGAAGMDSMIMGFLDYHEEMAYFGERVLPLMKQAGLRHD